MAIFFGIQKAKTHIGKNGLIKIVGVQNLLRNFMFILGVFRIYTTFERCQKNQYIHIRYSIKFYTYINVIGVDVILFRVTENHSRMIIYEENYVRLF